VVNHGSDTVAAVDLAQFRVLSYIPVAPGPDRIVIRPHSQEVFVVGNTGSVSVVSVPERHVLQTFRPGPSARDLVFSSDGKRAYLLEPRSRRIDFLACEDGPDGLRETGHVQLAGKLAGLALTPDGKTLIAADTAGDQLVFVSVGEAKVVSTVRVGRGPGPLAVLPDGSKVFVADTGEEKISAVEIPSRQILSHIEIGDRPTGLLLKPDGGELFVFPGPSARLTIVDAFHDHVEQSVSTGRDPVAAVSRRDSSVLYVASATDGSVGALDIQNRVVLASAPVGVAPSALALTPDERFLVVADRGGSSLAILDANLADLHTQTKPLLTSWPLLTTVTVGAEPVDVVVPDGLRQ